MKVLLVSLHFPPESGIDVQRPLKFATHLAALGIETHVLASEDPRWIHRDDDLAPPTQAWVHRVRYFGPEGHKPGEELPARTGLDRALLQARSLPRRLLVPDENVSWNLTAIPAAIRIVRQEGIDVVLTTSPPSSVHLIGAAVKKATGAAWVADLRDSLIVHRQRRAGSLPARIKGRSEHEVAKLVARSADAIVAVSEAIAEEARRLEPRGSVTTIADGSDFDDFAGLEYRRGERFRITQAGSCSGERDPRPFLTALSDSGLDVVARFVGEFRASDREWAERLGLGDRLELHGFVPRRRWLELQRDSDALLLLIPEADGHGKGVLSGQVFEYLAAERPILAAVPADSAAADLLRKTGSAVLATPEDSVALRAALEELYSRWTAGTLDAAPLSEAWREKVSRATRVEELADVLRETAA
jgi:glycosyltransferase involved in cell wall biosynthesis